MTQSKRLKIAYIFPPMWNPLIDCSVGIWNHQITRRLIRHFDVVVYAGLFSSQKKAECYEGVQYRRFTTRFDGWAQSHPRLYFATELNGRPIFASDLYHFEYALKVALDLRRQHCDIVHVYNFPQFIPIIKRFNPGIRIVLNMHGEWLTQINWRSIDKKLRQTDLIIACSEFVTEKIRRRFPRFADRCHTAFMGVDPDHFCPRDGQKKETTDGRPRLLYVGRISPEKGLHVLLDAFPLIAQDYPEAVLEIIGPEWIMRKEHLIKLTDDFKVSQLERFYDRNYLEDLRERIPSHLTNKIFFRGLVPHADVARSYQSADIVISPSFYESLGMSIIEAMACQCAVVATRGSGAMEVVTDGRDGMLVEPGDTVALAEAILRLLGNEPLRETIGRAARSRAMGLFSWDRVCEGLGRLYTSVAQGQN